MANVSAADVKKLRDATGAGMMDSKKALEASDGDIVAHFASSPATDVASLLAERLKDGRTVAENIEALAGVIGEKIELRRAVKLDGQVATYLHRKASDLPPQVGVLVQFSGDDLTAARGAAMQVAAMRPRYLTRDQVPADVVDTERRIAEQKAREQGKPEQAVPKIVEGSVNGYFKTNVLLEQESVQDNKRTVKALLDDAGVTVTAFAHFEVGAA